MAAPADYLDAADLKNALSGGLIREDVLDEIFDISDIPTPFLDSIGTDTHDNPYTEWTEDVLDVPDLTNARVSGSDNPGTNNAKVGTRSGNHSQISTKKVEVTTRVQNTDNIGRSDEMGYQSGRRLQELRRDQEAIALSNQASVQDDNNATAGKSAGLGAILATNDLFGAGGASGGFNTGTKLVAAPTPGTGRALSWTYIRDMVEATYLLGAMPTQLMSVPQITKRIGSFLIANATTAAVATPTSNISGTAPTSQVAQGYVDAFKTGFGFLMQIVPNRLQQTYLSTATPVANVYGYDPEYIRLSLMGGYETMPLAKLGLSDRKLMVADWTLKVMVEKAHFVVRDILPTSAVVA
jgi:hypothetical protein